MKTIHLLALAAAVLALALSSCAELAGTSLAFDSEGNASFQVPRPLVIPAK
jgi:hypothetical protein